jgi:hypothetical protein
MSDLSRAPAGARGIKLLRYLAIASRYTAGIGVCPAAQLCPLAAIIDQHAPLYPGPHCVIIGSAKLLIRVKDLGPHAPGKILAAQPIT